MCWRVIYNFQIRILIVQMLLALNILRLLPNSSDYVNNCRGCKKNSFINSSSCERTHFRLCFNNKIYFVILEQVFVAYSTISKSVFILNKNLLAFSFEKNSIKLTDIWTELLSSPLTCCNFYRNIRNLYGGIIK